jgi:hypothetical protein
MSKQNIKKFKKNDYSYDDEDEYIDNQKNKVDKYKAKRVERALRTKDISALLEEDDYDDNNEIDYWKQ